MTENIGDCRVETDFSRLEKLMKEIDSDYYVDIGVLGAVTNEHGESVASYGATNEFGSFTKKIPKRSFIRMPLEKKKDDIFNKVSAKLQALMENQDVKGVVKLIGIYGEVAIKEAFATQGFGTWAPNAPITIMLKREGETPLIDEGTLRRSITSKVGKNK